MSQVPTGHEGVLGGGGEGRAETKDPKGMDTSVLERVTMRQAQEQHILWLGCYLWEETKFPHFLAV